MEALKAIREEEHERKKLEQMKARSFDLFEEVANAPEATADDLGKPIVERERVAGAGALAQLSHEPDMSNVGLREPFSHAMRKLFGNLVRWKKKGAKLPGASLRLRASLDHTSIRRAGGKEQRLYKGEDRSQVDLVHLQEYTYDGLSQAR